MLIVYTHAKFRYLHRDARESRYIVWICTTATRVYEGTAALLSYNYELGRFRACRGARDLGAIRAHYRPAGTTGAGLIRFNGPFRA